MNYLQQFYSNYDCDENGNAYKNGKQIKPFNSNGYKQVLLFNEKHERKVCGVHIMVAMKYLNYYDGCVVHHKDHNRSNNHVSNLEVIDRMEHFKLHGKEYGERFRVLYKGREPWNKGKKMTQEFREHCSIAAKKRGFVGNQFIDRYGNKR